MKDKYKDIILAIIMAVLLIAIIIVAVLIIKKSKENSYNQFANDSYTKEEFEKIQNNANEQTGHMADKFLEACNTEYGITAIKTDAMLDMYVSEETGEYEGSKSCSSIFIEFDDGSTGQFMISSEPYAYLNLSDGSMLVWYEKTNTFTERVFE